MFGQAFPDRYFQIGMAEQNLFGVTAGLARAGLVPFAMCYCSFALRRAYDFVAIAEAKLNAKVIAALPGLTTDYGATHQGIEDLALGRRRHVTKSRRRLLGRRRPGRRRDETHSLAMISYTKL